MKFSRISPQKTRLVADMVRGKKVEEALNILRFTNKKGAHVINKLLKSAVANAEVKNVEEPEILTIEKIWVCQGPAYRRQMPRARGRANVLRRPTSHITIVVKEDMQAKEEAAARQAALEAKRAKKKAAKKAAAPKKEDKKEASSKEKVVKKGEAKAPAKTASAKKAAAPGATESEEGKKAKKTGGKSADTKEG